MTFTQTEINVKKFRHDAETSVLASPNSKQPEREQ